jgi:hypothetical protein
MGMVGLSFDDARTRLIAFIALIVLALVVVAFSLRGGDVESARDFEECVEALGPDPSFNGASPASGDERKGAMTDCNARFAGRRKPGGGYSYYDFMQGRNFDIAGPNPTEEERALIDRAYIDFLDTQRRETVAAGLAKKQDEQFRADLERARQAAGPPLVLIPKNPPLPAAKRSAAKAARCEESSFACSWSKFSTVVKNAFASSSTSKP